MIKASIILGVLFLSFGCLQKQTAEEELQNAPKRNNSPPKASPMPIRKKAPDNFDFSSTKIISIKTFLYYKGEPLKNKVAMIYDHKENLLHQTRTDEKGGVYASVKIPDYTPYLLVKSSIIGSGVTKKIDLTGLTTHSSIRIEKIFLRLLSLIFPSAEAQVIPRYTGSKNNISFLASELDNNGVPNNILKNFEEVPIDFLERIDASIPERKPVPEYHPHFIEDGVNTNIQLSEEADVWLTFLHEGAGYKNTMGFFTYPTDSPPTSLDDIQDLKIIFPNMSLVGAGGGLESGDTVHLGKFPAGTSIGYFLMANAWSASNLVTTNGLNTFFSLLALNNTEDDNHKHHNVLFWDETLQKAIIGFEDLYRSNGGSDDDFNDAVFYVTTNPVTAVVTENIAPIDTTKDNDNDGIDNQYDDYPEDPLRAFNNYYPLENSLGTLLFEDLWPHQGDYDFNDLVLTYNFNYITNSNGEVQEILASFKIKATGAALSNGIALLLDVPSSSVESVTGQLITEDYITLNPNGTEAGMENAVVILCDNINNYMPKFANVYSGMNIQPYEFNVTINFNNPAKVGQIGFPPYKPFLIKDLNRALEIHQMDYQPTSKFHEAYLTKGDDNSDPGQGRFFRNHENMPWVLNIPYEMPHPKEKIPIFNAFKEFAAWAKSGGAFFSTWYLDNNNNVDKTKIIE